jgi:redox-sensitive bicupin YhaK (pirin superfamily)
MKKQLMHILQGKQKNITDEETVLQPLPHKDFRFASPFIVIHHMLPKQVPAGAKMRIHPHPHRGFSPVTFMIEGEGYHKDSAGNYENIGAGGVQWMFAGKGILHSEGPSENMLRTGGAYEFIQLWINAPKANKGEESFYQAATKEQQPKVLAQEGVELRLACGEYEGMTGPLRSFTPLIAIAGTVAAGRKIQLKATPGYWTLLYIAKGSVSVNGNDVDASYLVIFDKEGEDIEMTAKEDAYILYLSAEPIDEPVAAKDNYVMNTAEEVEQAIADYEAGLFGTLDS